MNTDRMSFDEACAELGITEEELEQLVAAGEIATVKEGDTLYFKKEVVRKFKLKKDDAAILLSEGEIDLLDDSNVEEIDLLSDEGEANEGTTPLKPVAAAARSADVEDKMEISLDADDDLPSLDLDSDDDLVVVDKNAAKVVVPGEGEGDETLLNMDGLLEDDSEGTTPIPADAEDATLLDTDLLDLSSESDPFNADTAEETTSGEATEAGTLLRGGGARVMQMKRKSGNPGMTVFLALAALVLLLPLGILTHVIFVSSQDTKIASPPKNWITESNILEGMVEGLADFFKPAK